VVVFFSKPPCGLFSEVFFIFLTDLKCLIIFPADAFPPPVIFLISLARVALFRFFLGNEKTPACKTGGFKQLNYIKDFEYSTLHWIYNDYLNRFNFIPVKDCINFNFRIETINYRTGMCCTFQDSLFFFRKHQVFRKMKS